MQSIHLKVKFENLSINMYYMTNMSILKADSCPLNKITLFYFVYVNYVYIK